MIPGQPSPPHTDTTVRWLLDPDAAQDLTAVLSLLEDFLRHASGEAIDELAAHHLTRPLHPDRWASWLADYLGDQVLALRAATATAPTTTGDPR